MSGGIIIVALILMALAGRGGAKKPSGGGGGNGGARPNRRPPPPEYRLMVERAAVRHEEFTSEAPLLGLIEHESAHTWDPTIRSPTGALGLGQFTRIGAAEVRRILTLPAWRKRYEIAPALRTKLAGFQKDPDARDAELSIEAAAVYLAHLLDKWDGNLEAALTEYNAGGVAAAIVARNGTHAAAVAELRALPPEKRSQSDVYAPAVLAEVQRFATEGAA